jgi:glycosyltransferase involved in cell wall biosynthesis
MPFGMPDFRKREEQPRHQGPLVVSIGVVSEVKGLAQLIVAFGLLGPCWQDAKLVIAGPGDDAELERWRTFAREHAPGAHIELPGYLHEGALHALLGKADLAVQLRTVSNGEASGATAECLAAGVATIVTEIGSNAEFPPGVVATVPPEVSPHLLAETIGSLLADGRARMTLAGAARDYVTRHSFRAVAEAYLSALELG